MSADIQLADGLKNVAANLGTARDKAAHTTYSATMMSPSDLFNLYAGSWLAAAIVDYPAEDATRKWRYWRADKDQISKIEAIEDKLDLKERTHEALVAARLYGGSAIYINTRDRRQDKPLKIGSEIVSLVVLTSNTLKRGEIVKDINSEYFGKAEFYSITDKYGKEQKIHASRLALFYGARMPADSQQFDFQQNWGRSVLVSTLDAINNANTTMANVASLVFEAKVDIFKFQGFAQLLAENGGDRKVYSRLHSQAAIKGINGAVVLDAEDEYDQKNASFASLPEIMREFKDDVAGAARIPSTRLFGRTASSLANTGDGDERIYYDRIEHEQTTEIGPALTLLDECIITQALGSRPPEIFYEWSPLRQISGKERADIFKTTADAARAIAGSSAGPLLPMDALSDAFANELTEQGVLPGLDQAIAEYGSLSEQELIEGGDL